MWKAAILVLLVACTGPATSGLQQGPAPPTPTETSIATKADVDAAIRRACDLPAEYLRYMWRGHDPKRSEDVMFLPQEPNVWGTYGSHSGPWPYLQDIPLVLYGPERIAARGEVSGPASLADIYPTAAVLLETEFEPRDGEPLTEALKEPTTGAPDLIVTIVWDGVGDNVLERYPDSTPTLHRLIEEGVSFTDAVVGSSPTITPATHGTIGTGAFPRRHGVVGIDLRIGEKLTTAMAKGNSRMLRTETFADQFDLLHENVPKVGLLGRKAWHLPMMSKGATVSGADKDLLAMVGTEGEVTGYPSHYSTPSYVTSAQDLFAAHVEADDRLDGRVDGRMPGHDHDIAEIQDSPAWIRYVSDLMMMMLEEERFGVDGPPDLFFVNFKMADVVGHAHSMDSLAMRAAVEAQDEALDRLVRYLDRVVDDHVVILTADHGSTPALDRTGAWGINAGEAQTDLNRALGVPAGETVVASSTAYGLFLDREVLRRHGLSSRDVAAFLNSYTLEENVEEGDEIPEAHQDAADRPVLAAAWAKRDLPRIIRCAFGSDEPPAG